MDYLWAHNWAGSILKQTFQKHLAPKTKTKNWDKIVEIYEFLHLTQYPAFHYPKNTKYAIYMQALRSHISFYLFDITAEFL